jgi:hypothetical protein
MTRDEAIEIARRCAKAKPQSYYAEPFEPHEWVVDAILEAASAKRGPDPMKQGDQVALLKAVREATDGAEWRGLFTYPNCGWDLVQSGLATEDRKITTAGRAALFLLGEGPDPTPGKSFQEFSIPLRKKAD